MVAGLEEPTAGSDPPRRSRHHLRQALPAAGQHRLPELRAVPAPRRVRERRVRPAPPRFQGGPPRGRAGARARRAAAPRPAQARPALRRPAAAHRPGPGDRQPAQGAAARRAARRARPQAAPPDADRAQADPDRGRHHLRARHARPGGGHDDGRHGRGDERGPDRAARRPRRALRAPDDDVRRELPRPVQPARRPGSTAGTATVRSSTAAARPSRCPRSACPPRPSAGLLVGVRPEKIQPAGADDEPTAGQNRLTGGVVVDASFTGVSTQYLVRLPWGQEAVVFAQNLGLGERFPTGTPVVLAWDVEHTFALVGDATEGTRPDGEPADGAGAPTARRPGRDAAARRGRLREPAVAIADRRPHRARERARAARPPRPGAAAASPPTCCSCPAWPGWPCSSSCRSSRSPAPRRRRRTPAARSAPSSRPSGSRTTPTPIREYAAAAGPVLRVRGRRHRALPAHRLPAGLHDRVQGRPVAQPAAGAGRGAVLLQLHPAHPGLAADPRRGGRRRPHA